MFPPARFSRETQSAVTNQVRNFFQNQNNHTPARSPSGPPPPYNSGKSADDAIEVPSDDDAYIEAQMIRNEAIRKLKENEENLRKSLESRDMELQNVQSVMEDLVADKDKQMENLKVLQLPFN